MYSKKSKLDRRNTIMAAVKKELKAHNAFVAPELLHQLAESLDTAQYYRIEVIRDADGAAQRLRLKDQCFEHSWAGSYGEVETGTKIFGQIVCGKDYSYEFSCNGNSDGPDTEVVEAEFDINRPFCMLIESRDWRNMENDGCNHDYTWLTLVIYSPESVIDEDEYAAQKAAELDELCQLR